MGGGASKTLISKEHYRMNSRQKQALLKWHPIEREIQISTHKYTWKVVKMKVPEELATQMPANTQGLRIASQNKLATKPKWLGATKITRGAYRNRAFCYNTLPGFITAQTDFKKFKKELKKHMSKIS